MRRFTTADLLCALLFVLTAPDGAAAGVADIWMHPLQVPTRLTQDFIEWYDGLSAFHLGEDYATCSPGIEAPTLSDCPEAEVYAAADGTVQHVGPHNLKRGYGWVVIIEHDLPPGDPAGPVITSLYAHLKGAGLIAEGTEVQRGDPIGRLSKNENENGGYPYVHLHFGIRKRGFQGLNNNPVSKCWFHAGYTSLFSTMCFDGAHRIRNRSDPKHYDVKSDWFDPSNFIAKRGTMEHQEALGLYVSSFSTGNVYHVESDTGLNHTLATGLGSFLEDLVIDAGGVVYIGGRFVGVRRVDTITGLPLTTIATNVTGPEGPSVDFYGDREVTHGDLFVNTRFGPGLHTGIWRIEIDVDETSGQNVIPAFSGWGEGTTFLAKGRFAGNLLAVDNTNDRVVRVSPPAAGGQIYGFAQTFIQGLINPIGIAADSSGDIFVTEFTGRIRRFNSDGQLLGTFASGLGLPFFIEVDAANNVYVVDNALGRVRKYRPNGTLDWISPQIEFVANPNFEGPMGLGIHY